MIGTSRFYNRFSFKIILSFMFVLLFFAFIISMSFYMKSSFSIKENVRESALEIVKQTAGSLSFIFNSGSDTSDFMYSNLDIQNAVIKLNSRTPEGQSRIFKYMRTMLNQTLSSNSFVKNVYVLKEDSSGMGSGGTFSPFVYNHSMYLQMRMRESDQEWIKEAKRKDGDLVWQGLQYDVLMGSGGNEDLVLPVGRVLKDFNHMNRIGFILVYMNGRSILNIIEQLKLGETGKFFVVDSEGKIMIHSDFSLINKRVENPGLLHKIVGSDLAEFDYTFNGVPYYGVKQLLSNGWMIVGTVPVHEITGELKTMYAFILISAGLLTLLATGIGLLIVGRVTKPIHQLTLDMRKVQQGDLTVRTDVKSDDEVGLLSRQFNSMLQEIEQLLHQVEEEQGQKLQAELRAVMHRIHPHFLLNTLSTFWWLNKSNQNDRVGLGLSALILLLDSHMGKSGSMITLEEELDFLQKYIAILELRYQKTFRLDVDVELGMEKLVIPRMLLQPLVENAIFHGIIPKDADGRISIRVHACSDRTEFLVTNDGLAIGEEKLKMLNEPEKAIESGEMGIGLRHVYDTLRYYYAGCSEWSVTSTSECGTTVRILLGSPVPFGSRDGRRKA